MTIQEELDLIATNCKKKLGRNLTRQDVLDYASSHPKSALWADYELHDYWNDEKAANAMRLEHAGTIIMRYRVIFVDKGESKPIRYFVSFTDNSKESHGYEKTADYLKGPRRKELIRLIVGRVRSQMTNYPLDELQPIIDACDEVLAKL